MSLFSAQSTALPRTLAPRRSFVARLTAVAALHRQRHALARLDARLLDDTGLTPADVESELARPIWDAPDNWRR